MTNQILFNHVNKIAAYGCMFKAGGAFASRYQEHKILGQLAKCYAMCFHGIGIFFYGISLYSLCTKLNGEFSRRFNITYWGTLTVSSIGGGVAQNKKALKHEGIKALYVMGEVITFVAISGVFASIFLEKDPLQKLLCVRSGSIQVLYLGLKSYETLPGNGSGVGAPGFQGRAHAPSNLTVMEPQEEEVLYLGREEVMEEVLTVLDSRGGGNNVLLNGPAGTGKTEFVRYLAYKINKNEIPGFEGYTVYSISGTELMQGAWMRGALEQRVIEIGRFLQSQEHAILFIDEIHQLVPGRDRRGEHGLDMAGQLLPYLTHRNVRVIGATTPDESEGMNQNRPFLQRFTSVSIPEMTRDLRQMVLGRLIQREEEREFTEGFAQRIMEYNQQHGKRSPREDKAFFNLIVSKMRRQGITADAAFQQVVESGAMTRNAESMPLFLSELTADLSEVSYSGRDREIGLLLDILYSKEEANNVILNADAGSGKTEMIRYIASRIRRGEIPGFENFKVYSTSAQELIAGGSQQGEVEKRVEKLFKFLDGEGDVILFVDEIHQLIGQRGIDGMFLTKLLKSRIRVIGATTPNEALALNYNRPFKQRFTMMLLASMTEELRLEIVRRCLGRHAELEFPNRFAQSLIQYNNSQGKNSVREDKQLLGIIASRMSRSRSTAATAFQQITMNEL